MLKLLSKVFSPRRVYRHVAPKWMQHRAAALAGGGQRECARRLRQIWRCSLNRENGLVQL